MSTEQRRELRRLEGQLVHLALAGGDRLDEVALVSAGYTTVWVFSNGRDVFVPAADVVDFWAARPLRCAA